MIALPRDERTNVLSLAGALRLVEQQVSRLSEDAKVRAGLPADSLFTALREGVEHLHAHTRDADELEVSP